jgi:hypothetical protein
VLPGAYLPDYSVTSAMSLLNKRLTEPYRLYGGVPAEPLKALPPDSAYFERSCGFVD